MDKNIRDLLKRLKIELVVAWVIILIVFILGENQVIPNGVYADDKQMEFYLNIVCIVLTLAGLPLSLKLFSLNTTRSLRWLNHDDALAHYHKWSVIRLCSLLFCIIVNVIAYFLIWNTTGMFCALIILLVTLICWPSYDRIKKYLDSLNNSDEN